MPKDAVMLVFWQPNSGAGSAKKSIKDSYSITRVIEPSNQSCNSIQALSFCPHHSYWKAVPGSYCYDDSNTLQLKFIMVSLYPFVLVLLLSISLNSFCLSLMERGYDYYLQIYPPGCTCK